MGGTGSLSAVARSTSKEHEGVGAGRSRPIWAKAAAPSNGAAANRPKRTRRAETAASTWRSLRCLEHGCRGIGSRKDVTAGVAATEPQSHGETVGFVPSYVACNAIHIVVGIIGRKVWRRRRWCAGSGLVYVLVRLLEAVPIGAVNRHRLQPNASRGHGMRCLLTYEVVGRRGCSYSSSGSSGTCTRARQRGAEGTVRTVGPSLATSF